MKRDGKAGKVVVVRVTVPGGGTIEVELPGRLVEMPAKGMGK